VSIAVPSRTRAALASVLVIATAGLGACDKAEQETNAAAKPVELSRYLPQDSQLIQTVDVTKARQELDLPEDANALPTSNKTFPRAKSPDAQLFEITSRAYPDVAGVFASEFNGRGASPLDGTLIRAAAGNGNASIVSTAEPLDDIERKLELAGYSRKGKTYVAGQDTPEAASRFVADAGSGRFVFAREEEVAQEILRRIRNDASPGEAAEALEPAAGSVRLAMTNEDKRSCVTAFSAAMEATGEGAALALIISGDKPDPDLFDPNAPKGIATGTPTVLVDALIVPIRVKKPLRDGLDALEQVVSTSKAEIIKRGEHLADLDPLVPPPFKAYDCP
jgi:hypothetical protein